MAPRTRWALGMLVVGTSYFLAGKAGLLLAVGNSSVSAVWPPAGIAVAALLLGGSELWPAVFAGAFFVNITTTGDLASTVGLSTGNTLEALVGAFLANRYASGTHALERPGTVLTFAVLSGFLASTIAATVGTASLTLAHLAASGDFLKVWGPYWLGDSIGIIEVGSLILAVASLRTRSRTLMPSPGGREALGVGVVTVATALAVFGRGPETLFGGYPLVFLVLPPVVWASFRFGPVGATAATSTVSVIAILSTIAGLGPFSTLPGSVSLLALRVFIGSVALTAVLVAAEVSQHQRLEVELNRVRKELQRLLHERTAQLDGVKSLAKVGHWTFDIGSEKTVWSDEMYGMFGYGAERFPVDLTKALENVHPDDRDRFMADLQSAIRTPDPSTFASNESRYRLLFPGGEQHTVASWLQVTVGEDRRAFRVIGTVQDITERQGIEEELLRLRGERDAPPRSKQGFLLWAMPWIGKRDP